MQTTQRTLFPFRAAPRVMQVAAAASRVSEAWWSDIHDVMGRRASAARRSRATGPSSTDTALRPQVHPVGRTRRNIARGARRVSRLRRISTALNSARFPALSREVRSRSARTVVGTNSHAVLVTPSRSTLHARYGAGARGARPMPCPKSHLQASAPHFHRCGRRQAVIRGPLAFRGCSATSTCSAAPAAERSQL